MILQQKKLHAALICLTLLSMGCKEFIEPSIDDRKVILLAPSDGTETKDYAQTFWWEEVEDALSYRLQVVTPGFEHTTKLVLDTVVKKSTKFKITLDPAKYEWRVKAQNGSSATPYTTAVFTIYPTSITEQKVQLDVPLNNTITNQSGITFKWLKLFGAEKYRIQLDNSGNSFSDETTLFLDKTVSNLEYTVTLDKDKTYQWRVKGLNGAVESKWSSIQNITYDATPPPIVELSSPMNNASVASPVSIKWLASTGAKKYILYCYKGDPGQPYNNTFPLTTTSLSYNFTSTLTGEKILWEVKAVDEAGNVSTKSELRSFTIK